ncbi:CBS domain-containing protein [Nonomuraea sp. MCN248]|uniref:CBS domain-containing protein n=1 Tax=Nonomuraea corallina TaxID=2989783 RepID=A0ABT4SAH7_9ACTN|nr:CBS domain-containing protein [Nonomuraea corallina]MDA0634207.1 CBS domain-containing protein [Nonomuraea corallina]
MTIHVRDVMGRVAIAVLEDASFSEIIGAMKRYAVGAVTVIDADRRPVGVVSEDDLLLKEIDSVRHSVSIFESPRQRREHQKAAGVRARQLMTSPAVTVTPGTTVRDAARLMHDRRIKQVPVIDPVTGRIAGTLHQRDVLRVFTRPACDIEADVRARLPEGGDLTVRVEQGVVVLGGRVRWASEAVAAVETARSVEGVVDVVTEIEPVKEDLVAVPPLM